MNGIQNGAASDFVLVTSVKDPRNLDARNSKWISIKAASDLVMELKHGILVNRARLRCHESLF